MEKKKNRKLLFQIGEVIVPLCLLMLVLFAGTVYTSTLDAYLKSQRGRIAQEMDQSFATILGMNGYLYDPDLDTWCYDYLISHPELLREPITEEETQIILQKMWDGENVWDIDWLEQHPEEIRNICARLWLSEISEVAPYSSEQGSYQDIFLMDVNEGREGLVYFFYSKDNNRFSSGDIIPYELSDHPAIQMLMKDPTLSEAFERVHDFPDEGSYNYICYKPVFLNGELRAVMGAAYGWEHLRSGMAVIIRNALLVGLGGLLFALFSILLILYKRAIAPVTHIQQSINHYIQTRNMEDVARDLDRIQERNEIGVLSDNLSQMVSEIDRYTQENIHLAQERERVETELQLASKIQQASLQRSFPESDAFALSAFMSPAREVGGDFYDFFYLDESHLALVIADVSGKGIPAALFMMMAKNMIKNYAESGLHPSEILTRTNLNVLENEENSMFVTVWLGFYEIPTGRITAVNAGHEYPMIRKKDGSFELYKELYKDLHGMIVGGYESAVYREYELQLDAGETLFLYTDGAPEATNSAEEMLGTEGVLEALNRDPDGSPAELIERVESAISTFVGDAPQFDDLTMLVIKRTK